MIVPVRATAGIASCLALLVLLVAPAAAQAAAPIPLPWQKGTSLTYQSTTVDERFENGKNRVTTTRGTTKIAITDVLADGYVQAWRDAAVAVEVRVDGVTDAKLQQASQATIDQYHDMEVQAQLDSLGLFVGVRNWQEIGTRMRQTALPVMIAMARTRPELEKMSDAELEAKFAPTLDQIASQGVIDATLGKYPTLYNLFTAPTVEAGKPTRYEDVMPSPVGNHPIPAVGMFERTEENAKEKTITIRWTQTIDPVKGMDAVWKMVEAISGSSTPIDRSQLPKDLELSDEATATVRTDTGVPQRLQHVRKIKLGGQTRLTTWTFVLVP